MGKIITKNGLFGFEEIKNNVPALSNDYEQNTLSFCHNWLNGKEEFILHTSGSTGVPKPITLSRRQMEASALGTAKALELNKGDTALICLNTQYIAGRMMLVRGMVLDMDLILVPPDTSPLQKLPIDLKIDFTAFVPIQIQALLEEKDAKHIEILNNMKAIIIGGASISRELENNILQLTAPVYSTYGMTETVSHIALRRVNGKDREEFYKVLPGISIDKDERDCLSICGEVTNQNWLQTNDRVEILENGKFKWLGRYDTIINSGGVKIQPEKVERSLENILLENGIQTYFIAALPHKQLGEAVTLFVEKKEDSGNSLLTKLRPYLDRFEIPKAIIYVDSFERSLTGKIDKVKLTNLYKTYYS